MKDENGPSLNLTCEMIGRTMTNAFGVPEVIVLPKGFWASYDWYEEQGFHMSEWVKQESMNLDGKVSLSDHIWYALWRLDCSRFKQGLPCPPDSPPEDYYTDFLSGIENGEIQEAVPREKPDPTNANQKISRALTDANGDIIVVTLPDKHWKHFDWLIGQGVDMDKWVKNCDRTKTDYNGFRFTFSGHIESKLVLSERNLHQKGVDVPLFINPDRGAAKKA